MRINLLSGFCFFCFGSTSAALIIALYVGFPDVAELPQKVWGELIGRESGPLQFRLLLQPLMAAILAIRSGRKDARDGRPPFFLAFVRHPQHRRGLLRDASRTIGPLFLVGVVLDVIYTLIVLHWIRPLETLVVAAVLAVIPYLLVRGLTNRVMTWWYGEPRMG